MEPQLLQRRTCTSLPCSDLIARSVVMMGMRFCMAAVQVLISFSQGFLPEGVLISSTMDVVFHQVDDVGALAAG